MKRVVLGIAGSAFLAIGCGGPNSSEADAGTESRSGSQVTGSINGKAVAVQSSAAQTYRACSYDSNSRCTWNNGLVVRLSEDSAICDPNGNVGLLRPGSRFVHLAVHRPEDAGPITPGEYEGRIAVASLATEGGCGGGTVNSSGTFHQVRAVDGSESAKVTIDAVSPTVRGNFSATLSSGAQVTGSFDAPFCNFYDWEDSARVRCVAE
ncbi:MAG: hypothetical protein WBV82_20225 [Myxococcaceae bacterium]